MQWWYLIGAILVLCLLMLARWWIGRLQERALERAQAEASLEKIRFLQRLDHELKNPLTAMQLALANLAGVDDVEKHHEIHASMHAQIVRMSRLISDLRKLASLEKGLIEQVPIQVSELLTEVARTFADDLETLQRKFIVTIDDDLPIVIGDRDLLQLALYNVLDNARKFTSYADTISLAATLEGNWIALCIVDSGRGIPSDDLPHVWEDLYRSSDVQGIPGSGVGLAMVKGIIEQHGGSVEIDSTYGVQTTITMYLPVW